MFNTRLTKQVHKVVVLSLVSIGLATLVFSFSTTSFAKYSYDKDTSTFTNDTVVNTTTAAVDNNATVSHVSVSNTGVVTGVYNGQTVTLDNSSPDGHWSFTPQATDGSGQPGETVYTTGRFNVSSRCEGERARVEVTVVSRNYLWDYNVHVNGADYGGIDAAGDPKVLMLSGNTTYEISIRNWSIDNYFPSRAGRGWSQSHTTPDCMIPPPPPPPPPPQPYATPDARCSPNTTRIYAEQSVTWSALGSGGNGSYIYEWRDNEGAIPSAGKDQVVKTYNSVGTKTAQVRVSSNGQTSGWVSCSSSVEVVYPPPTVDLRANPTQVRYNNPSSLTWTSRWTSAPCQASLGWSGNKALNNTIGESTGNLIANSAFRLICPAMGPYSPAVDDAYVGVTSCVAGAKMSVSKKIVKKGESVVITFNTGAANPSQCVLRVGASKLVNNLEDNGDKSISCSAGGSSPDRTYNYPVNGEATVTFECEGQIIKEETIRVLPEFQET